MIDGVPTYIIKDEILVDGGRVEFTFYDETNHAVANFILPNVKQVKGKGTADAKHLKTLSDTHKRLLKIVQADGEDSYKAHEIFLLIEIHMKNKDELFVENHWKRTLSELVHWNCFALDNNVYFVNIEHIDELLRTGEFSYGH